MEININKVTTEEGIYEKIGKQIGMLVDKKNKQYGNSVNGTGDILTLLYPNGIETNQYNEVAVVVRIIDKLKRISNGNQGNENAWNDIAGYAILMSEDEEF